MGIIYIYRHRRNDTNQIFYVGIGIKNRPYDKNGRNTYWNHVVKKHGYSVEIIAEVDTWELACELECLLIEEYGRRDLGTGTLVNMTDGGEGSLGRICTEETKAKLSSIFRNRPISEEHRQSIIESKKFLDMSGEKNPMWGKHHTDEAKKKISESNIGRTPWNKGIPLTEEHRQKVSDSLKGDLNPFYNKNHTEESKLKMSEARKGTVLSQETKDKIGEASKIRHKLNPTPKEKHAFYGKKRPEHSANMRGENNINSILLINMETGIFYYGYNEASNSTDNFSMYNLRDNLNKNKINKTPFKKI